ncbi:tripartite motif-containing protein 3-like [Centruroides sculpturatus]|uniref:tripartite motif-containing protein 3-like n=1 Tax=Centruroides sculpturatus TaxID=218467 RepID=UPI000C6DA5A6|nr:tripartite motif-containing protein 3-like [Centruroides sculpturatus]XP_023241159.1 tripartite motif-containing protein 3-like [Centruroides sculpturatus]XP_023241160.1 tripartite motif-containing protein 3-like [Centruroides sculpturatus]
MSSESCEAFVKEYITNNQMFRKIKNAKALIDKNYYTAKHTIEKTVDEVESVILHNLEVIFKSKLEFLKNLEKKFENFSSPEDAAKTSEYEDISEISDFDSDIECCAELEFKSENPSDAKYYFGYIKCFPPKPEDFTLIIVQEEFDIGKEFTVCAKSEKDWCPSLISSLFGFMKDESGREKVAEIVDKQDGSYIFSFRLDKYSKYFIEIMLYGRPIKNSPVAIDIKANENKLRNKNLTNIEDKNSIKSSLSCLGDVNKRDRNLNEDESLKSFIEQKSQCSPLEGEKPASASTLYSDKIEKNENKDAKYNYEDWFEDWSGTNENYKANEILLHDEKPENDRIIPSVNARLLAIISESSGVNLNFPFGIEVNCNNDIIICDTGHNLVWILDEYGKPKTSFQQAKEGVMFKKPSSVAATVDGNIVIRDDNGLYLFNRDGNYIRSFEDELLKKPFGLAVTESKKVITLNETTNQLLVFNESGKLECSNVFEPLIDKPRNSKCCYMVSYSDKVVLSDFGTNQIYKTTLDGKLIKMFGSYGRAPGNMIRPSGIALDPYGTMLIAETGNDRIQIFDWEGDFLGEVTFSHPIHKPFDIAITKYGRLHVLNTFDHCLAVYHLETDK